MNLKEENARLNEIAAQAILVQENEDDAVRDPEDQEVIESLEK